jgi:SHS2 domain-containing protein
VALRGHETIDHAADMGIRGWGRTPAEAFEEVASAMFEIVVNGRGLAPSREIRISREGDDLTGLLIEFLNGCISEADVSGTVLVEVTIGVLGERNGKWYVEATALGVPVADARDRLLVEVKAAARYGASVLEREPGAWVARCVVDL